LLSRPYNNTTSFGQLEVDMQCYFPRTFAFCKSHFQSDDKEVALPFLLKQLTTVQITH
jgi:hypothetical protein